MGTVARPRTSRALAKETMSGDIRDAGRVDSRTSPLAEGAAGLQVTPHRTPARPPAKSVCVLALACENVAFDRRARQTCEPASSKEAWSEEVASADWLPALIPKFSTLR